MNLIIPKVFYNIVASYPLQLTVFILMCALDCVGQTTEPLLEQMARFEPSPTSSNLGSYGGNIEIKKSTGGINKSIALFNYSIGDLQYSPQLEYYSTGVAVNDWGTRHGMGWGSNFTGLITRVVKGVPDEGATSRVHHDDGVLSEVSEVNYNRIKTIANKLAMRGVDAEYDEFHYNIFGRSGSFIIVDGQAVQLNHQKDVKIETTGTYDRRFVIIMPDGYRYSFGFNHAIELTSFDNENVCDQDASVMTNVPTAWYLTEIQSPSNRKFYFNYEICTSNYFYNYSESVTARYKNDPLHALDSQDPIVIDSYRESYCIRQKISKTPLLSSVSADNFTVYFDYINRIDLLGEKLIDRIRVYANQSMINEVTFSYRTITSSRTFEAVRLQTKQDTFM